MESSADTNMDVVPIIPEMADRCFLPKIPNSKKLNRGSRGMRSNSSGRFIGSRRFSFVRY
jgi:hypothetical protein